MSVKHFFLLSICSFFLLFANNAFANLGVTPTIIYFEDGERFKDVTLINNTEETKTYEMSWKFFEMQSTGTSYKPIESSLTEFDTSKYVFFTPRRITIPANGSQKIRMAYRRPSTLPDGDFHAHLLFAPADDPIQDAAQTGQRRASAGVAMRIGYSIPIIIRNGSFQEAGKIGRINLKRSDNGRLIVDVPITRNPGKHGTLAALEVYHQLDGREKLVGEVVNANIFPEIEQRTIGVALREEVQRGQLKIVLKSIKAGNPVFDEQIFPLQ